jgi:hypothetical protein
MIPDPGALHAVRRSRLGALAQTAPLNGSTELVCLTATRWNAKLVATTSAWRREVVGELGSSNGQRSLMPERFRPNRALANTGVWRPSRLTCVAIAAALFVGLSAAGCGGSSTPSITKAAFLSKGNAICARGNATLNTAAAKLGKNPSRAQIVAFEKSTEIPSIQAQITGIRALGAPSGDQTTVTSMLNLAQTDLNKLKSNPLLIAGKINPFTSFANVAHPYGLTACASNS